jgi:hypothetical protein
VDGAKLDDNSGHVTIVFKICDKREKYPVTYKYILYANAEGEKDDEHMDNVQSGAWCFPILSLFVKEQQRKVREVSTSNIRVL